MSAWQWSSVATWDGTWTTTCKRCGEAYASPYHSQLDALRRAHECPEPPEGSAA
jgi:hypothetical protein